MRRRRDFGWVGVAAVCVFLLACVVVAVLIDWRISYQR